MTINYHEVGSQKLTERARRYFKDRDIEPSMVKLANARSLAPRETETVFHVRREAILLPYAPDYGIARVFDLPKEKGKFRTPAGEPARLYEPPLLPRSKITREQLRRDTAIPLLAIEGPFKALSAAGHGLYSVGTFGCWGWQKRRAPIADLLRYAFDGRTMSPIFDADVDDNWLVALALLEFGDWFTAQGSTVAVKELPKVKGRTTGIDDFLARRGVKAFLEITPHAWDSDFVWDLRARVAPFTDGGNARRLVYWHGDDLRSDPGARIWLAWKDDRWDAQPPSAPDVTERMKATVAEIFRQADREASEKRRAALRKWATASDSARTIRDAISLAASDPAISVSISEFDCDPHLLGVRNGTIDLRDESFRAATREDLITKRAGTAFDAKATCPRWLAFVDRAMAGDAARVAFLQRLAGYTLTGTNPERRLFILHGPTATGKTIYIESLLALAGDYGVPTKTEVLMTVARRDVDPERPTPFLVLLRGARLVTASEVGDGSRFNEALIKDLTGGDTITARGLKTSPVRFKPGFKVLVRANHKPLVYGDDDAIWERLTLVPFDVRIPESERDASLGAAILTELPGVLNWALDGARACARDGLRVPEHVRAANRAYRAEMDSFAQWLDAATTAGPGKRDRRSNLFFSYAQWCEASAAHPVSARRFRQKLEERGFEVRTSGGFDHVFGLRVLTAEEQMLNAQKIEKRIEAAEGHKGQMGTIAYLGSIERARESKGVGTPNRPLRPSAGKRDR